LLKPVPFNIKDGLLPDEAPILAVLRNPELRTARDHHGIANAQLLQAGLLPNPTLSYSFAALSGGLDQGKVTGFGLGLGWEVTSLITQSNKLTAAAAGCKLLTYILPGRNSKLPKPQNRLSINCWSTLNRSCCWKK
jgi:hypothetical protein